MPASDLVPLYANSLYVATQTIPTRDGASVQPNLWHWSFFITDARGHAVQHHWTVGGADQNGASTECYRSRAIRQVSSSTLFSRYVVFAKIEGWVHPGAQILSALLDALYKPYEGVPSTQLRDRPGDVRSCRTWIMHALLQFMLNEWLVPLELDSRRAVTQWLQTAVHNVIIRRSYAVTATLFAQNTARGFRPAMIEIPASF